MQRGNEPLLVFVHLRKTAGTTVSYIMYRHFRRGEAIDINGVTVDEANAQWNALSPEQRARVKGVRGHLPYGRDLFPDRRIICFSMVRDPVERVVSEYYFGLRSPREKLHAVLNRDRVSLEQFVNGELSADVHNAQTRMLAGAPPGENSREMLERALTNLRERLVMVGISERLNESLLLCRALLGWRHVIYRSININRVRPATNALPPQTLASIERANTLDRELYQNACARFEGLLVEHRITGAQARTLGRLSSAYGTLRRTVGIPRELWFEAQLARERRRARALTGDEPQS